MIRVGQFTPLIVQRWIRSHPTIFFPTMQIGQRLGVVHPGPVLLRRNTEFVLEGFFRSGNTFAILAFVHAQPRKVIVADHSHAPATIIQAVRWQIPTLVLFREPLATCTSLVLKHPKTSAREALRDYTAYYRRILPYKDGFVLGSFEEATTDMGLLTARVNQKFGTTFGLFDHTPQHVRPILDRIERDDKIANKNNINRLSIPTPQKEEPKATVRVQFESPDIQPLMTRARNVYEELYVYHHEQVQGTA